MLSENVMVERHNYLNYVGGGGGAPYMIYQQITHGNTVRTLGCILFCWLANIFF